MSDSQLPELLPWQRELFQNLGKLAACGPIELRALSWWRPSHWYQRLYWKAYSDAMADAGYIMFFNAEDRPPVASCKFALEDARKAYETGAAAFDAQWREIRDKAKKARNA